MVILLAQPLSVCFTGNIVTVAVGATRLICPPHFFQMSIARFGCGELLKDCEQIHRLTSQQVSSRLSSPNLLIAVDYIASLLSYIGLATPGFFLALLLMTIVERFLKGQVGGLFSADYVAEPWSWNKFVDLLSYLWIRW